MVDKIISEYLKTGRRLIVPELGVFIKREDRDDVVFSTLLTRNDGILLQMIQDRIRMSEEKATIILNHYVTEVNRQLDALGKFSIERLGTLIKRGDEIDFIYSGDKNVEIVYRQRMAEAVAQQNAQQPQQPRTTHPATQQQRVQKTPEEQPRRQAEQIRREPINSVRPEQNQTKDVQKERPVKLTPQKNREELFEEREQASHNNKKDIFKNLMGIDAPIKKVQKIAPDVRRKNTQNTAKQNVAKQGKQSADIVLIAAIIAAIIAIGVIIYGATAQHPEDEIILDQPLEQMIKESETENASTEESNTPSVSAEASAAVHF